MVTIPRRSARLKSLVKTCSQLYHFRTRRQNAKCKRAIQIKKNLRQSGVRSRLGKRRELYHEFVDVSDNSDTGDDDDASLSDWSGILGSDWRQNSSAASLATSIDDSDSISDILPDLAEIGDEEDEDEDQLSFSDQSSRSDISVDVDLQSDDSDIEALDRRTQDVLDELLEIEDEDTLDPLRRGVRLNRLVLGEIAEMYARRYEAPRDSLPRGPSYLRHILTVLKTTREDQFRQAVRVTPATFDAILACIETDQVFANDSNNAQMAIDEQLAITLYRFGHDGNAASLQSVANWAGVGKGTVTLATRRVMTALLRPNFMDEAVRFPTPEEKEEAKQWVEGHSCKAWRGGWCMVDGTLVPLEDKPTWFGESYFDRKCRYSLNVQVVSLPNLRIIDFSYGHVGSTHDSTAWEETRLAHDHDELLEDGEWVWADSAYPINTWVIAPYKKPERDLPDNSIFNNHVSMVRIRSEHAIGFLKGRFQSLKNLRIRITSRTRHIIATYWIAACIAVHSFALQCEDRERTPDDPRDSDWLDPFIAEGMDDDDGFSDSDAPRDRGTGQARTSTSRLQAAKACREKLKERLFHHKARRVRRATERQLHSLGLDVNTVNDD